MIIDHIFIFSDKAGKESDELVKFGLSEGSNRIHQGQGTANRKFYFKNFFFEILWVVNHEEITSENMQGTKLFERSEYKKNGGSPFGLCLVNEPGSDKLFESCYHYNPCYFPPDMPIEVITNSSSKSLPWTFRLPFKGAKEITTEPTTHLEPICNLTKAIFQCTELAENQRFVKHFEREGQIHFIESDKNHLILEFDYIRMNQTKHFDSIPVTIRF